MPTNEGRCHVGILLIRLDAIDHELGLIYQGLSAMVWFVMSWMVESISTMTETLSR